MLLSITSAIVMRHFLVLALQKPRQVGDVVVVKGVPEVYRRQVAERHVAEVGRGGLRTICQEPVESDGWIDEAREARKASSFVNLLLAVVVEENHFRTLAGKACDDRRQAT